VCFHLLGERCFFKLLYYSTLAGFFIGETRILGVKIMLTKVRHLGKLGKNEVLHLKGDWPVR